MKLQERFEEQAQIQPSQLQRMSIYQKFLDKSHRSISYHKVSYYTKVTFFSLGLFLIVGTVFYSSLPQSGTPYQIAKINDAYTTLHQRDGQFVQANTIGEVFFTQGDIEITHGEVHLDTTLLSENDRVLLAPGAEMHFRVDTYVEAKIVGPAEFILENRGLVDGVQQYVINLLSGNYLEVITVPEKKPTSEVVSSEERLPVANVIVQAPEFTLEQVDTQGSLDVVISTTDDGKRQIENNGTTVVIKKIVEDKQTFVAVQKNEKISINEKVEFISTDVEDILQQVKEKQLTITYELDQNVDTGKNINDILVTSTGTRKSMLDTETMQAFHATINATFLSHDLSKMKTYYNQGDKDSFLIAYGNLLSRLQRAHILLGITYTPIAADITTLATVIQTTQAFATTIQSLYYIEPASLEALHTVVATLTQLITQPFGSYDVSSDDIVHKGNILPLEDILVTDGDILDHETSYETLLDELEEK